MTILDYDTILVFDRGEIVERGTAKQRHCCLLIFVQNSLKFNSQFNHIQIFRMQEDRPLLQNRQTYKSELQITLMVLKLSLSLFYIGYCLAYLGQFDIIWIKKIFPYDDTRIGDSYVEVLLNGCIPVGAMFGALINSYLITKLSRRYYMFQLRNLILMWNIIALIAGGYIFIPNFYTLLIFRFLQGMCVGAFSTITPLMIRELAPTQISGTLGSYVQLFLVFGIFFANILNFALKIQEYWPIIFGVPGAVALVQTLVLLFVFPYQTPRYLFSVGREEEAKKLMELIYKEQYVDQIFMQKTAEMIICGVARNAQVQPIQNRQQERKLSYIIQVIVAFNLVVLRQLSEINAIIYGRFIGNGYGQESLLFASLINLLALVATFASRFILDKFGRKHIIQCGTFFLGVGNLFIALGIIIPTFHQGLYIGLFMVVGVFGLTLGPLLWLYIPEIVQDKIVPFTTAVIWFCASIIFILEPIIFQQTDESLYQIILIFVFMGWFFVSFFFNHKFLIESKDKTFRDIQYEYSALKIC